MKEPPDKQKVVEAAVRSNLAGMLSALACCGSLTREEVEEALGFWVVMAVGRRTPAWCEERLEEFRASVAAETTRSFQALARHLQALDFRRLVETGAETRRGYESLPQWPWPAKRG
jgi:hypothetical protein